MSLYIGFHVAEFIVYFANRISPHRKKNRGKDKKGELGEHPVEATHPQKEVLEYPTSTCNDTGADSNANNVSDDNINSDDNSNSNNNNNNNNNNNSNNDDAGLIHQPPKATLHREPMIGTPGNPNCDILHYTSQ